MAADDDSLPRRKTVGFLADGGRDDRGEELMAYEDHVEADEEATEVPKEHPFPISKEIKSNSGFTDKEAGGATEDEMVTGNMGR